MKKIYLVILNWNGEKFTVNCLKSLSLGKIHKSLEPRILIVDNGSREGSLEIIKNFASSLKMKTEVLENKENLGFAEGNNVGIRYALKNNADYVCLLNNDTRVDPFFLEEMIKTAEGEEKIGMVGGKIYFEKGYEFYHERYQEKEKGKVIWYAGGIIDWKNVYTFHRGVDEVDKGQYDQVQETDFINGCLMLVKRKVFQEIGLFDPQYFLYFEDADLSIRAKKAGFKLMFCPWAKIWHLSSASSGSGSSLHDYFLTRNRLLFGMKFAPFRSKIALLKESVKMLKEGRPWQKIGVKDFYLRKFGKGSWHAE